MDAKKNNQSQCALTKLVERHVKKLKKIRIATELPDHSRLMRQIFQTVEYIQRLPRIKGLIVPVCSQSDKQHNQKLKDRIFRRRNLEQILQEGYYPTCSDVALLFYGLMRAQGIRCTHLEAFHEDYLFERSFHGHVFVRVSDGRKKLIVDPANPPKIYQREEEIFPYIIAAAGDDSWEIGIRNYQDLHDLREKHLIELINKYQATLKKYGELKIKQAKNYLKKLSRGNEWTLYILECADGTLYTGITKDLAKRLRDHNDGRGAKYTRGRGPVKIIFQQNCPTRSAASRAESQWKKLSRRAKLNQIKKRTR